MISCLLLPLLLAAAPPDRPTCDRPPRVPNAPPEPLPAFVQEPKSYDECMVRFALWMLGNASHVWSDRLYVRTDDCTKLLGRSQWDLTEAERARHWAAQVDLAVQLEWPLNTYLIPEFESTLQLYASKDPSVRRVIWSKRRDLVSDGRLDWNTRWSYLSGLFPGLPDEYFRGGRPKDDSWRVFTTALPATPSVADPAGRASVVDPLSLSGGFVALSAAEKRKLLELATQFRRFFLLREVFMRPEFTPEPELRELARANYEKLRAAGVGKEPLPCPPITMIREPAASPTAHEQPLGP